MATTGDFGSRPWHRGSVFDDGPRKTLTQEQKSRWRWLVRYHTRAGRIAPKGEWVLESLLDHLSRDGRCDPSYGRLALSARVSSKTAENAVRDAFECGLLHWERRIVSSGDRISQTSNAYELRLPDDETPVSERRSMPYQDYLKTPEWRIKREAALSRACFACEVCGALAPLHIHHLTYLRRGEELPDDLMALCKSCHNETHMDADRRGRIKLHPPESGNTLSQ